jgi:dienelactone hydrolase
VAASVTTTPSGADVAWKSYATPGSVWEPLGKSPVKGPFLPRRYLRWEVTKEGYEPMELAGFPGIPLNVTLVPKGTNPEMVRIPAGPFPFRPTQPVTLDEYWLDRYEVTNRQFKEFVDRGGYANRALWKIPFQEDGRVLTWDEAMKRFRDTTGRPGPAGWEMGTCPEGQDGYPVTGVSWYEAAAYAESVGKVLPTVYHWRKAAHSASFEIIQFSNFAGKGLARAGSSPAMTPNGNYDMAGNAKEWCWNEDSGNRYLLGGAWNEASYQFLEADAQPAMARAANYGFRCARYTRPVAEPLLAEVKFITRDYTREKPVSDEVYRAYSSLFAYDRTDLDAVIEKTDEPSPFWRREKVMINAAYGNERLPVWLFLPKNVSPPYQTVVFFPGASAFVLRTPSDVLSPAAGSSRTDYLVRSGRAVVYPVYKHTYERGVRFISYPSAQSVLWRDMIVTCYKDLARTVDYLLTRPDIDKARLTYYGVSAGSVWGSVFLAQETRFRTAVFVVGGLSYEKYMPEVDPLHYASRSHTPVLMLNGRYDSAYPLQACQIPLFKLLGVPEKDKRHVLFDTSHDVPRTGLIKETLEWLDRYLGQAATRP